MALPFYHPYRGSIGRFFAGDPSLVGYWQLQGNSWDNSGNGNNGTDTAIQYKGNGAITPQTAAFATATTNGISIPNTMAGTIGTNDFCIMVWMYAKTPPATVYPSIFASDQNVSPHYYGPSIFFDPLGANAPGVAHSMGFRIDTSNYLNITSPPAESLYNKWTLVTYQRRNGVQIAYYNGSYVGSNADTTNIPAADFVWIAGRSDYAPQSMSVGMGVGEVAYLSRSLSDQEISQYYQWATSQSKPKWLYYLPAIIKNLSETLTNTDTLIKGLARTFSEAITNSDTFSAIKVMFATFIEAITNTDTIIKQTARTITESITNADTLIKKAIKTFSESITNSDTIANIKSFGRVLLESISNTDTLLINGFLVTLWKKISKPTSDLWSKLSKPASDLWKKISKPNT